MSKRKPARTIKARSASKIRSKAAGSGQPKGRANSTRNPDSVADDRMPEAQQKDRKFEGRFLGLSDR
jgi:hypothetical protein